MKKHMRFIAIALTFVCLCSTLTACSTKNDDKSSSAAITPPNFPMEEWGKVRAKIPCVPSPVDIVESTFTTEKEPDGRKIAEYLGASLIAYPKFSIELKDQYMHPPAEELRLLTCLFGTAGTQLGDIGTEGEHIAAVDSLLGGTGAFITKEQVQAAAQQIYGDEFDNPIEIVHQSVPIKANEDEQFIYNEELGVYSYPKNQPMWYLPLLLWVEEGEDYLTWNADIVFVRYADKSQNSFFGFEAQPIARWEMEPYINRNIDKYKVYTVGVKEVFGKMRITDFKVLPKEK